MVLLVGAVVAWHLAVVTVAALPADTTPQAMRPPAGHLLPFFRQDWRLFAPNPVASDRALLAQPVWQDGPDIELGEWVDITDIELDAVRHQLIGGRGGYATNRLTFSLDQQWTALLSEQQAALLQAFGGDPREPANADRVDSVLTDTDTPELLRISLIDTDEAAIRLATDVLRSIEPDRVLLAVRYAVSNHPVRAWDARDADERPAANRREGLWWAPALDDPQRRAAIADYVRRHR